MNSFIVFSAILAMSTASLIPAVHPGGYLVRAPKYDSASIESHRFGGNFAYSTAEAHAFAKATPQINTITHPVAETIHTHVPAPIATHTPGKIVKTTHVAQPILKAVPILAHKPVVGVVGHKTLVHQPLIKKTVVSTPVVHQAVVAGPVVHAAPAVHALPAVHAAAYPGVHAGAYPGVHAGAYPGVHAGAYPGVHAAAYPAALPAAAVHPY